MPLTRDRACDGKMWHASRKQASRSMNRRRGKYGKRFTVYRCPFCGGYHLATKKERE